MRVSNALQPGGHPRTGCESFPSALWPHVADRVVGRMIETIPVIAYTQRIGASREIVYVSPQVESILGWTPADYAAPSDHWFVAILPIDRDQVRNAVSEAIARREPLDVEYRVATPDGRVVWLRDLAAPLPELDHGAQVWHGLQCDITADKAAEARLHQFAYYDSLTGLPNRRLCIDQLHEALNTPGRPPIALLFLDLDRFKVINDGIGHAAGDDLLVAVARRLSAHIAGRGSLARFGGDEFVAVLEYRALEEVEALAAALLDALRRPFLVDGYELIVEGTIGIAVTSPDLTTPEALLRAADVALYRAKGNGGNTVALHDPAIDRRSPDHLEHEAELRRALRNGEFRIDYQPVVDVESGRYLAVEALLRWNHPRRGLLAPSEFIGLADETGLIVPLGQWALEEACRQMRCWQERYPALRALRVSVNLSGRQLRQASLAADVALALEQSGLAPEHLALEIQEGDAIADPAAISDAMQEFRRLGVKVTIDGFGKGWGALGALTQFAIDDLKIDGSCITRLGQRQQDAGVVRALVGMAKTMGVAVTAGAVETDEQLALVRELGCDGAQGRRLAPPLSVAQIETLFSSAAVLPAPLAVRS